MAGNGRWSASIDVRGEVREVFVSPEHRDAAGRLGVTVTIPFASNAATIGETIASMSSQRGAPPFELLLVSNGTRDASVDVAIEAAKGMPLRIVACESVGYDANGRNVGIREATGDKVLFMDADDTVCPAYVALMAAALDETPLVSGLWELAALNGRPDAVPDVVDLPFRQEGWPFVPTGLLGMDKVVPRTIGGLRLDISMATNNEWCFRAFAAGFVVKPVPGALCHYRLRSGVRRRFRQRFAWGYWEIAAEEVAAAYGMPPTRWSSGTLRLLHRALAARSRTEFLRVSGDAGLLAGRLAGRLHARLAGRRVPCDVPRADDLAGLAAWGHGAGRPGGERSLKAS